MESKLLICFRMGLGKCDIRKQTGLNDVKLAERQDLKLVPGGMHSIF